LAAQQLKDDGTCNQPPPLGERKLARPNAIEHLRQFHSLSPQSLASAKNRSRPQATNGLSQNRYGRLPWEFLLSPPYLPAHLPPAELKALSTSMASLLPVLVVILPREFYSARPLANICTAPSNAGAIVVNAGKLPSE
jgi:hypothetical protein